MAPIAAFLWRAVEEAEVAPVLPRTLAALQGWDAAAGPPGEEAFAALAADLRAARQRDQETGAGSIARAASRLNADVPGLRSLLPMTARRIAAMAEDQDPRAALLAASAEWGKPESWAAIRRAGGPVTDFHLLAALDLKRGAAAGGGIAAVPPDQRVFQAILLRTLWISLVVTACCLLLGYPLAWLIATAAPRWRAVLLAGVMLPFWTSLVVRTAAWMVLLQREGVANAALGLLGLGPLALLQTRFAVVLAMVHILLPFMVLPLAAALRGLDWRLPRAAESLGAPPWRAFLRVTLPLTLPGIGAGCLLVFIQALGFFVTPALLGGPNDQMLAWFIGFYANRTVNWGLAAALSVLLLAAVALLVGLYARLVGFDRMRAA